MNKLLTLVALSFVVCNSYIHSQNIVTNGSYEDYSICPNNISQVYNIITWNSFRPTPDYYNSCSYSISSDVPINGGGFQCPVTGNAYCGIWSYHSSINNLREYIGSPLSVPLIQGAKYYVKMNANLIDADNCGVNKLGVLFSTISYNDSDIAIITNFAHIYVITPITDTVNWTSISGSFIADSAYQYIILGNFFDDTNTDTVHLDTSGLCLSYYFIDDICVSPDSLSCTDSAITLSVVNFGADTTTLVAGGCVNFNVNTVVNYKLYEWTFSGGNPPVFTDTAKGAVNVCYADTGLHSVTMAASDSCCCGDTIAKAAYINVVCPPQVVSGFRFLT